MARTYSNEQNQWIKDQYAAALDVCKDSSNPRTKAAELILGDFIRKWPEMEGLSEGAWFQKCRQIVPSHRGNKGKREVQLMGFHGDCPFTYIILYSPDGSDAWRPVMLETFEQAKAKLNLLATEGNGKPTVALFERRNVKAKIEFEIE